MQNCLLRQLEFVPIGVYFFFFSSRRRHTRSLCDWSSDVCSSDLFLLGAAPHDRGYVHERVALHGQDREIGGGELFGPVREIGRASCRERGRKAAAEASQM